MKLWWVAGISLRDKDSDGWHLWVRLLDLFFDGWQNLWFCSKIGIAIDKIQRWYCE